METETVRGVEVGGEGVDEEEEQDGMTERG